MGASSWADEFGGEEKKKGGGKCVCCKVSAGGPRERATALVCTRAQARPVRVRSHLGGWLGSSGLTVLLGLMGLGGGGKGWRHVPPVQKGDVGGTEASALAAYNACAHSLMISSPFEQYMFQRREVSNFARCTSLDNVCPLGTRLL
eukprot:7259878-Pyramimonas_sp.AAC.2